MLHSDEEDDFSLTPYSKLSSIFNTNTAVDDNSNNLTYKAPKQPKSANNNTEKLITTQKSDLPNKMQSQSPTILLAKVIDLWKTVNKKNTYWGKYMVAITRVIIKSNASVRLIIYKNKTNVIINEILGPSFQLSKDPNNFASFTDIHQQKWHLHFDCLESLTALLREVKNTDANIIGLNADDKKESNSSNNSHKEDCLSRITKLGQSTDKTLNRYQLTDSETESSYNSDSLPAKHPVAVPRKSTKKILSNNNNHQKSPTQLAIPNNSNDQLLLSNLNNNTVMLSTQRSQQPFTLSHQNNSMLYSAHQQIPDYSLTNYVVSQNLELKSTLTEINSKLNNFLAKSDTNENNNVEMEDVKALKSQIKCQNLEIDNLKAEIERSKSEINTLSKQVEKQNEQSENYQKRESELQEYFNNEKEKFAKELNEKSKEIAEEINKYKELERAHQLNREECDKEIEELKRILNENSAKVQELKEKLSSHNLKDTNSESVNKIVKQCMNEAFVDIMHNFDTDITNQENYDECFIRNVLLNNLKRASYKLVISLSD